MSPILHGVYSIPLGVTHPTRSDFGAFNTSAGDAFSITTTLKAGPSLSNTMSSSIVTEDFHALSAITPNSQPNDPKIRKPENSKTPHRPNDVESEFYSRFVDLVQERLADPDLQISEIASAMNLGQFHFTRKIFDSRRRSD
ncbi:MAG: hypothetical protein K2N35_11090 [Muribaculaceae bacterium]|nr:hypothetical protein [Muribaculaceae bacterium]